MSAFSTNSCAGCGLEDTCAAAPSADGPLRGASMVAAATGYFLFPAAMALAGALVFDETSLGQLLGGVAGLGIGMMIAVRVARRLCAGMLRGTSA